MRHRKAFRKFSRTPSHRKSMFANMVMALVESGRIKTTEAKAKELRRVAERMVTLARQGRAAAMSDGDKEVAAARLLAAKRQALAELRYPGKAKRPARDAVKKSDDPLRHRYDIALREEDEMYRAERVVEALFGDLAERFQNQPGGYTRVIKLGNRLGDNAPMAYLEFIDYEPPADVDEDEDDED